MWSGIRSPAAQVFAMAAIGRGASSMFRRYSGTISIMACSRRKSTEHRLMARIILQYRDAQRDPLPMTLIHTPAMPDEASRRRSIAFLNLAHGIDHFVLLIYPTVVIGLEVVYGRPYSELIALSSAAFLAFGIFSLPAGWLADRWSRRNMMAAFYIGCGVSLIGVALAPNLVGLAVAMF